MGQNNRQRRAAKAKQRHQREVTQPRAPHRGTPTSGPARESDGAASRAEQRDQHAWDTLQRLARLASGVPAAKLPAAVRWAMSGVEPAALVEVESLLVSQLMVRVSTAWEGGWQPRDLHHVAVKGGARQGDLAAELIVQQALASGAQHRAPQAWRDQIDLVAGSVVGPPVSLGAWRPVEALVAREVPGPTAWAETLGLLKKLAELPVLPFLLPPPSQWDRAAPPPTRSESPDRDRVLGKIRALLAKAEATNHPAEAEAFTAKAQELMSRHAIDEALLHFRDEESIALHTQRVHLGSPYASTKMVLLSEVARANRARAIYFEACAIATVVGTPVDVDQVEMLFTSLLIQATRAMAAAGKHGAGSFDRSSTFRRSFLTAYAYRIGERLTEADRDTVASYGAELVPVLQRQAAAVDAEFDRQFPTTSALNTGTLDRRGWEAGREAADQAVLVAGRLAG